MAITNSSFRVSGLASGLDTDSMVEQLMNAERIPLDRMQQEKELVGWKINDYREITTMLSDFKKDYMDFLGSETNMLSMSSYKSFNTEVVDSTTGMSSSAVEISTSSNTFTGNHTIKVEALATAAIAESAGGISKSIQSTAPITDFALAGKKMKVEIDGVRKEIELDNYTDINHMMTDMESKITTAFGTGLDGINGKVTISETAAGSGMLDFKVGNGSNNLNLYASELEEDVIQTWSLGSGEGDTLVTSNAITDFNLAGKTLGLTIDGVKKDIALADYADINDMIADLESKIETEYGLGDDGLTGKMSIVEEPADSGKLKFTLKNGATSVALHNTASTDIYSLNIKSGESNKIDTSRKLSDMADEFNTQLVFGGELNDEIAFEINGQSFTFDQDVTLEEMMTEVNNNEAAKVSMKYDEVLDKVVMQAKVEGSGVNISINETKGNIFASLGIATGDYSNGSDAKVIVDGETMVRNSNDFTVNDVTYELKRVTPNTLDVGLETNTEEIYENIETFINKYNEMLDTLNKKVDEKRDKSYLPLTDKQKDAMDREDIEKWEEKAKTGLLRNDSVLERLIGDMRRAAMDAIEGSSKSLYSIGISSGNYKDKGKLIIDKEKLKEAIRKEPDVVANVFAKKSEDYPSYKRGMTSSEKSVRMKQQGFANRISDILEENISPFRNVSGQKGVLLEKAGKLGDSSEVNNFLAKQLLGYDRDIAKLKDRLNSKEDAYYKQFTMLETYMNKMNNQSASMMSMFSGGQ